MANKVYLAVDLGAGSGRLMAAVFDSKTIQLEEVSRWASAPVKVGNSYHWDVQAIFNAGHHKKSFSQGLTQFRRNENTSLGVYRMFKLSVHRSTSTPLCTIFVDFYTIWLHLTLLYYGFF